MNALPLHNTLSCKGLGAYLKGTLAVTGTYAASQPVYLCVHCSILDYNQPPLHLGANSSWSFELLPPGIQPHGVTTGITGVLWKPWCYWYCVMTHSVPLSSQHHLVWVTCTWVALQESASRGDHMADWQRDETQSYPNRHGEGDISKYFFDYGIWWIAAYFSCGLNSWILEPSCSCLAGICHEWQVVFGGNS